MKPIIKVDGSLICPVKKGHRAILRDGDQVVLTSRVMNVRRRRGRMEIETKNSIYVLKNEKEHQRLAG